MSSQYSVFYFEHSAEVAAAVEKVLREGGMTDKVIAITSCDDLEHKLASITPDLILINHNPPLLDGMKILARCRERFPEVPFIFLVDSVGDGAVLAGMAKGVADFVLKKDLEPLVPSIRRALSRMEDIRQRRLAEEALQRMGEQLIQAQKMETVGRLSNGVAHDFNNLLTIILAHSDLLLRKLKSGDPVREGIQQIRLACERGTQITRQLLGFSRKQVFTPEIVELNSLIRGMERMLRVVCGEQIDLFIHCGSLPLHALVDAAQIQQVLLNLALNARDAMPGGGRLDIAIAAAVEAELSALSLAAGNYAVLTVRDTGCGMDAATKARIFDPFFTTKGAERGTGLGLSVVQEILNQHKGHIAVESEPGKGTCFTILLPTTDAPTSSPSVAGQTALLLKVTGTILLVEDDIQLSSVCAAVLSDDGHRILQASDPAQALVLANQYRDEIHLLLTDLALPQMDGYELARILRRKRPQMDVLYMSGQALEKPPVDAAGFYIAKPFSPAELSAKVFQILQRRQSVKSVLVVDDDPRVRAALREILEEAGFEVSEAVDGKQALTLLEGKSSDLILLDLAMPDMDGLEVIRQLRRQRTKVRIVAMSGAFGSDILKIAKQLGAHSVLQKPLTAEAVLEAIEREMNC